MLIDRTKLQYICLVLALLAPLSVLLFGSLSAADSEKLSDTEIPVFARLYRTSCSTCHTAAPKLNVLGEAFRLNGYRFPENNELLRKEKPIPLGTDPWKEQWPRAIWPGELPETVPFALRIVNDVQFTRDETVDYDWTYRFPNEIYLLSGGSLGERIGFFVEAEWTHDDGVELIQAKVPFQDPLPFLPDRLLNIWVGKQNLYLLTFGDRQIDRAARQRLLWSEFDVSELELINPDSGEILRSANDLQPRFSQPAIEINGIVGHWTYYAVGLSQGTSDLATDNNDSKDFFYKLRHKFGGLSLDGRYDPGGGPVLGTGGQLFDRALIVEHFGYVGEFPVDEGVQDEYRTFGLSARWLNGPLDLGAGYVWGEHDNPWGLAPPRGVTHWSAFTKAEYFIYPWLMGSLKGEVLRDTTARRLRADGFSPGSLDSTRILPGVVFLIRQNVRAVVEAEFYSRHDPSEQADLRKPHSVWVRLDVAF
jgi:hypothetical protein